MYTHHLTETVTVSHSSLWFGLAGWVIVLIRRLSLHFAFNIGWRCAHLSFAWRTCSGRPASVHYRRKTRTQPFQLLHPPARVNAILGRALHRSVNLRFISCCAVGPPARHAVPMARHGVGPRSLFNRLLFGTRLARHPDTALRLRLCKRLLFGNGMCIDYG